MQPPGNIKSAFKTSLRILLCAFLLVGCELGPSRKITVRFWNGFTGPDGRTMLKIVKRFNRENPDIRVLMQRMDWGTYYNKLFVAGIGNRAPEVFIIHAGNIERFMQANFIRTIDDLVAGENGMDTRDFSENIWNAVEKNGRHYGLPLDVHIIGMYYNRALFRKAGIVDEKGEPKPPETREEFLKALSKLTKDANGDGQTDTWGFVLTWYWTNLYSLMCQWEGKFFTPDNDKCLLNSPENVEALQFCVDLIRKYKYSPPPENFDSWIGFRQGKVGIAFEGIYMLADLERQKDLDFAGAPMPVLGKVPAAWADSHILCLKTGLEDKKLDAAWRFMKYLSDNSLDWAEGGQVPVRSSLRNTERFRNMKIQWEFAKQIPYIRYVPRVPFIFEYGQEFNVGVEKALRGTLSPKQALDEAAENVNEIIERRNKMIEENLKRRP